MWKQMGKQVQQSACVRLQAHKGIYLPANNLLFKHSAGNGLTFLLNWQISNFNKTQTTW